MRAIVVLDRATTPPVLRVSVHGAPHRRIHFAVLREYRKALWEAWLAAGEKKTIDDHVDLSAIFIHPTGPDLDNLMVALFQALDGKTGTGPTILADDKLISKATVMKLFP